MKLNLIFIVMDLLTLLAYPIVYAYGKVRTFAKSKEGIRVANILSVSPVTPARYLIGKS